MKISINFVRESYQLHSQLQSIACQLDTINSTREVTKLTRALDQTSCALREMKDKVNSVFGNAKHNYFENLEDEIIHMYGRIEDALVARKVSQIQQEAHSLKQLISQGNLIDQKSVTTLKRHIFCFLKEYRPGIQQRQVIADAQQAVKEASIVLKGKCPHEKIVPHFEWLIEQRDVRLIEEIALEPGQYEDLFDIAAMVYQGKSQEAKGAYHQLPEKLKRTFHQHMRELKAVAFEDQIETIQALLATANQLVNNEEAYPTPSQIKEIFLELQHILLEEAKSATIFPLRNSAPL